MTNRALLTAALLACAAPTMAQTAPGTAPRPAAPPAAAPGRPATTVPVPRHTFIQTMDAEFRRIDSDKDGKLTRTEIEAFQRTNAMLQAQARNRALFNALDKDRNGQLTAVEFAALASAAPIRTNPEALLAQVDGNRDKSVTLVEYRTGKLVSFDRMDTDKDSVVSIAEMRAAGLIK